MASDSVQVVVPPPCASSTHAQATGPSFSYNIGTNKDAGSSFQSNSTVGSDQSEGGKSATPTTASSLQPPPFGKPGHSNVFFPGMPSQNMPDPVHSPVSVPRRAPSIAAGFSFSRPSQLPSVDAAHKNPPSYSNSGVAFVREAGTSVLSPSGTQGVSLPAHPSLSSSTIAPTTPNLFPATMWRPTTPPFPGHPGLVGAPATPGPPGIPPSGSLPSTTSIHPITPAMPAQQQLYPTFHSPPTMPPHTQGHWFQPPQIAGMQRPPYLPYPAVISNPFPLPVRGLALPSVSLPGSHPPGVSPVGPIGGTPSASEHTRSFVMHSELPPPGTDSPDLDKRASGDGVAVNNEEVDAWTAHKTDTGAVYYYNAVTAESTYERPHNFKGEADKVTVQPTPISWEKLAGTDWTSVTTDDGKKYYYNTKTKVSSWQIPVEVTELWKKKQEEDLLRTNTMLMQDSTTLPEKGSGSISLSTPSVNTGGRDATALRPVLPGSSSALDSIKKKLQDSGIPVTSSPLRTSSGPTTPDVNGLSAVDATIKAPQGENSKDKQDANGNMSDSSSDSEDVDSGPTMEECNIKFKEMLKERGVAPFSKWDKELPKIVFDPRFKAVPSHSARRSLFEHYVRTRAEEERKEKRAAQKAAVEGFRQLLEEASEDIDYKTEYQSFKKKWGSDPRFEALDRKEREVLLNERVLPLKRAAEEKIKAIREAAASSFKSMLRDKREIDSHSRWSRVKDSLRSDPRYKSVKHEDREVLFNEYISELRAVEDEVQRAAKAKREEQDKLKERERETRKRKEREEQEMERVRLKVRRKEAVSSYQALLVETIKDPQASWTESKPKLGKDPQGRATTSDLDQADTEKLFREHVKTLFERCTREFQTLLAEVITTEAAAQVSEDAKSALTSWSTAKRVLKPDPRYSKMPRKDRESLWRRYAEEFQQKRKSASEPVGDKLNAEKRGRNSLDSGSPAVSRRVRERR
ncbi:hypothetical protein IFM89_007717 [Coptis chinensis]|uniref:Pre-mRNA-processing protein 40C n=1 Tax=Coptis chinensis TaxID=261450 RepID=A0A835IUQ5_9MAGN|nr:hypothetical protein IFM89_007717 [Coptis chinensis]